MKIAIIGSGSWGTALAIKSCQAKNDTFLYCRNHHRAEEINRDHENKMYLPGVKLPTDLIVTSDLLKVMEGADIVLLVTPSAYIRETLLILEPLVTTDMILVNCAKGMERASGKSMSELMDELVGYKTSKQAILSGPNHAEEVGRNFPAATVVASSDEDTAKFVQNALNSDSFRVYINSDVIGVELAGTTKNIIALAVGIADGMNLGDNTKATLMTRGLHEMTKFGIHFGASRATYAGLAGMGDLVATCISLHSRNRTAGQKLAAGQSMEDIINHTNMVVEGFFAIPVVYKLAIQEGIEMPITEALYELLFNRKPLKEIVSQLMKRTLKDEMYI